MTNEEMATAIYEGQNHLLKDLYLNNRGIIYKSAISFYNRNSDRCMRCGVEVSDMVNEAYFVLPAAVTAYNQSDKQYKFITFLKFPLINCFLSLTGLRTQTGRKEPLNLSTSLDAPVSELDDITLGDTVEDMTATERYEKVEKSDYFNILYAELERLSDEEKKVIFLHYLKNQSVTNIAASENMTVNVIQSYRNKALRKLRRSEQIRKAYFLGVAFRNVGMEEFTRTHTSSTEWAVFNSLPSDNSNKKRSDVY